MKKTFTTDICANCGASEGLHHFGNQQCPLNGREPYDGKPQEWQNSDFEDSGLQKLHEAAPDLYNALQLIKEAYIDGQISEQHLKVINEALNKATI